MENIDGRIDGANIFVSAKHVTTDGRVMKTSRSDVIGESHDTTGMFLSLATKEFELKISLVC